MSMDEVISVLIAAYPHQEFPKASQTLTRRSLSDLNPRLVLAAVQHLTSTSQDRWRPSIGEIRMLAIRMAMEEFPSASEAWQQVLQEVLLVGSRGQPQFSHSFVAEAVKEIGWRNICMSDEPLHWQERNFEKVYSRIVEGEVEKRATLPEVKQLVGKIKHSTPQLEKGDQMDE